MRRLSVSFLQLAASSLLGQAIGFAVLAVVARRIGPDNLGAYAFASSLIVYFALPLSGIDMLAIRDIVHDTETAPQVVGTVLPLLVFYAFGACTVAYIVAPLIAPTPVAANMLRILAVSTVVTTVTLDWVLQGMQVFNVLALVRLLGQVLYGVAAFFLITSGLQGAYRYAWLNVFGLVVTVVATWVYTTHTIGWPSFRMNLRYSLDVIRRSRAFAVSIVMIQLYYTADFVLLGLLSTSTNVGEYLVAYKLPLVVVGFGSLWITVFYPHAATEQRQKLRRQIGIFTTLSLVLIIPLCAGSFVLGTPLITTLFGSHYQPAGLYFKLLLLAVGFGAVDANIGQILLATGHERMFALGTGLGALTNIILNLILIPSLGPEGSAIATIITEAFVLVFMTVCLRATIGMPHLRWGRVAGAAASSLIMVLMVKCVFAAWPVLLRIAWGVLVYLVAALATRTLQPSDYKRVYREALLS
jgi:O-antigen/teichoic acid export membrane protein